ncbi:MAG TPA: DNA polymerase III subunit beta, partial [Vicinamibacteria bacterium]|nr:DNA polymerase III subunit beta [Vicinamibacteria bacterium]
EARAGEVRISATDLDVSLRCGCAVKVVSEGAITLGAKKLYEIARSLPESEVHLTVLPDSWATVVCDRVTFKMAGLPLEDFPSLPEAKAGKGISIPAEVVRALVDRTAFAITAEDARYYLAGALLVMTKEGVGMVATDGHRLSFAHRKTPLKVEAEIRVLVPRKAIHELGRLLEGEEEVTFQQVENHLVFAAGGRTLASKMIDAQFPAYEKVIAITGDKTVQIDREALASGIRRVSLLSSERSRAVKLSLSKGKLELTASSPELGEARESLPAEYTGETVEIGFNAQYLLDFLAVAGTEMVTLELKDPESQGVFKPTGESDTEHRYVVMPMRF